MSLDMTDKPINLDRQRRIAAQQPHQVQPKR